MKAIVVAVSLVGLALPQLAGANDRVSDKDKLVNINQASSEELEGLPGIGAKKAAAVIAFRVHHPFRRVQEVMRVKGIGPKLFGRIKELVTVSAGASVSGLMPAPAGP
jgi:competence protein ComEA